MLKLVRFSRSSGLLLHVVSLPGPFGIGSLGRSAYEFANFLAGAGQKIWQVLPLNPTGYGDSPYQCFSAFAGNPLLIDLGTLRDEGVLSSADLKEVPAFPEEQVDYAAVIRFKLGRLRVAAHNFLSCASGEKRRAFEAFCEREGWWLDDFAVFMALKETHELRPWAAWQPELQKRTLPAFEEWRSHHAEEIGAFKYWQFAFFRQWEALKQYCNRAGIRIMGDLPIYVAHDSSEVWAHPELFWLDENGAPTVVAGVPPDYFSATGQRWGNPIYRWELMERSGYRWWIERFRASLRLFDILRVDHFRGFEAYWEVPATQATAVHGRWVNGPGAPLFEAVQRELGELPIVAENLGVITPEVETLRKRFGYPGMSLLQFAFGNDPQGPSFRPHNYTRELVAYTGGHDNDTTMGWWASTTGRDSTRTQDDIWREREFAKAYLGFEAEPVNWVFIRAILASVADVAMIPVQDVLGLGSGARMNIPGTTRGNWRWRCKQGQLTPAIQQRLREMTAMYDR